METILILFIMAVGILVGCKFFPEKLNKKNQTFQTICTAILIFCMGVSLGGRSNLLAELQSLGVKSVVYSVVPIVFSVLFVYPLTKKFMEAKKDGTNRNS